MKKLICLILAMLIALPVFPALAAENTVLTVENPSGVNVSSPLSYTLTVGSGFESAKVYIDDVLIDSFASDGTTSYTRSADLSGMTFLGNATMRAEAKYTSATETVSQAITMVKMATEATLKYSETFDSFDGTSGTMPLGFTPQDPARAKLGLYTEGDNKALKVTYTGNGAFFNKSGMGYEKGAIFTLEFDVMLDNNTENPAENEKPGAYFGLELRDYGSHQYGYPNNGGNEYKATLNMIQKGGIVCGAESGNAGTQLYTKRWYQFRLVINSIDKGVQVYMKQPTDTDWVLQLNMPNYAFVGFKEFRFTGSQTNGNDSIIYDNIKVYEQRAANVWYAKATYADVNGAVSALPVSGGKIAVKFSEDMGSIADGTVKLTNTNGETIPFTGSYDAESYTYTMEPTATLRYGGEYWVSVASGTKSAGNATALSERPITVSTEKNQVHVNSVTEDGNNITVSVADAAANGESMLVCRYNGGKMVAANVVALTAGQGSYTVTMDTAEADETRVYILDNFTTMTVMDAYKIGGGSDASAASLIYPPESHPRVFLNDEYITKLNASTFTSQERNSINIREVKRKAQTALPEQPADGVLSSNISTQLTTRALVYALGYTDDSGNAIVDTDAAKETVAYTINYLKNPKTAATTSIDKYKDFGTNGIQTGALVYDWCYDVMTAEQRTELATEIKTMMYDKVQPCRPDNVETGWSDIAGKAVGQPLIYNSIAAVAIYDEYPEIYEAIMPKIQGSMAEIVRTFGQAGALSDGSIAYSREYYSYYVALLFDRMGYPNFYGDQSKIGYKMLYSRLPYGAMFKQGDDFSQSGYRMGTYVDRPATEYNFALLSTIYQDPYLRWQYLKEHPLTYDWESLILKDIDDAAVEAKLPDDLPLAYYIDQPKSEILARTSWQDGLDSPAVSALMSIHNRRTGDHDHGHIGEFQLYYKGPLTMPAGHYQGGNDDAEWGGKQWTNYYTRTVSANCVTVYDPNETIMWNTKQTEVNDGGQLMVTPKANDGSSVISSLDEQMSDENLWATTEAHYIGPNAKTPAFSYIKGDLSSAYSKDKMTKYQRSMVFMDTFDSTYPGVMVVYDRVLSKDASFKKKWLLQSVTDPQVSGNKITIVNTEDGANGKLVNTTLLPEEAEITKVGAVGKYEVDGKTYLASNSASDTYKGGIRLEVSPKNANREDLFLNAMYVTDADGNAADLPMTKEENDLFVGVSTLDRMVMFSKDGRSVNREFTLTVRDNGYDKMLCLIADVEDGNWAIEGDGITTVVAADADGHSLTFAAKPGTYRIYPTEASAQIQTFAEATKEKNGDFAIKLNASYTYVKTPNKVVNNMPYFAIADFAERYLDVDAEQNGNVLTLTKADGTVITVTAGSSAYTVNTNGAVENKTMQGEAFLQDGVMFITPYRIAGEFGLGREWYGTSKVLYLKNLAS